MMKTLAMTSNNKTMITKTSMGVITASLIVAITACSGTKNSNPPTTADVETTKPVETTENKAESNVENKAEKQPTLSTNINMEANTTGLSQQEIDNKLEQVHELQQGNDVKVTNKASETKLFEENHYKQDLYKKVLGVWQGVKDKDVLKDMGLTDEQIKNSNVEIGFMPDHDMQMRTYGVPAPEDTPFIRTNEKGVTIMTGRYIIKDGLIKIYFGKDVMANQKISVNADIMTLAPEIEEAGVTLQYKKIADWTLK